MQLKIGTRIISKYNKLILLIVVFVLAVFLRFYNIGVVPPSLYWDEVSIGYNAYSIAETGRDEYGEEFPLLFRGYEDYKTPGAIYLTSIPVKIFGLNEFSVRFPSALLGTLTVLATYFLVVEFLSRRKTFGFDYKNIAILSSLLVAISPWHIQFSRAAFEANLGLFFVVLGAYLFFRFVNLKKSLLLFLSLIVFALSLYFYRSMWVFVPLLLIGLYAIYAKLLFSKANIKTTIISLLLFILILVPFMPSMVSNSGGERASQVGILNNIDEKLNLAWEKKQTSGLIGQIIYDRKVVYISEIGKGYASHFLPKFLFLNGDPNPRHGVGNTGVLYFWGVLFLIPGIFALFKLDRKISYSLLFWLLIAPIPAALSYPTPHALRSINMIPVIQFIIVLGAVWLFSFVPIRKRMVVSALTIGFCLFFIFEYFNSYYGEYLNNSSPEWADGYKQLTNYVFENEDKYEKILISGHWWQPHMYLLFYKSYDPALYQKKGDKFGFDKYIFSGTSWDMEGREFGDVNLSEVAGTSNYLVALSPVEYELQKDNLTIIKEVKNKKGEKVFILSEPK